MAKFLIYCYDCDEEYEVNSKKAKCPTCGSHNTEIFEDKRRDKRKNYDNVFRRESF